MRFGTLATLFFASAAIAAPTAPAPAEAEMSKRLFFPSQDDSSGSYGDGEKAVPTGVAAFTESLTTIAANVNATNQTLNDFSGGLKGIAQLLKIQSQTTKLGEAIQNSTAIANATGRLSLADSTTVGQQFLQLQPQIESLLANIRAKRPEFDNAGFGLIDVVSLLRSNIEQQKEYATALGDATIALLDPSLTSIATPVNQQIQAAFDDTIAAYQGRGGLIEIPPGLIGLLTGRLSIHNVME
ncbi:hydrophobic surface binding protein A-domain-containing protein [Macrophomina phaseolina]|uniref:Hydrophobic surface binding protein A-domain-containing protein n=1 Tax=Macrophomina phaseolina TaxID=35725 RepID=A0ABQ8FVK1_9PEZI|nr:hydrophobic surface binding protein A-domain-containing protein [Macrophomina phaseolina]